MRISDWSSDVCSSDLALHHSAQGIAGGGMSSNSELDSMIEKTLRSIWPTGAAAIRNYLTPIIAAFAQSECQVDHYPEEQHRGDLANVAPRMSEALLYARFHASRWPAPNLRQWTACMLMQQGYVNPVPAHSGNTDNGELRQ